jgi:hypothetical protein
MPFYCVLCKNPDEYCVSGSLCSKCIRLKRIVACYDIDKVLESCEEIFVRELRPIKNRTEAIAQRSSKETTGVETRSKKKKEES